MIPLSKIKEIKDTNAKGIAIIEGKREINYEEFYLMVSNCVRNLINKYSTQKVKRAVFIAENRYEMLVFMSAFSTLKIPFIGLDYTGSVETKINCIKSIGAGCIVYTNRYFEEIRSIAKSLDIVTICVDNDFGELSEKEEEERQTEIDICKIEKTFEAISFTSGTSGTPKVVYRNKSFDARRFSYLIDRFKFTDTDRFLITVPFYHVSALGWARLFLNLGTTIVLGDINDPVCLAKEMVDSKVTVSLIVPNKLDKITKVFENKLVQGDLNLRFIIVGGKHFSVNLKKRSIDVFGPIIHEYYGSTETGVNVIADPNDLISNPESSGKVMEGSDVIILDDNDKPLAPGNKGKVAISSYQNMAGYLNAEANFVEVDGIQYIITPDYGWLDTEGYLYLTSRTSAQINIYKLENMISQIPGIDDSHIFIEADGLTYCIISINKYYKDAQITAEVKNILKLNNINNYEIVNVTIPYSMSGKVNQEKLKAMINTKSH